MGASVSVVEGSGSVGSVLSVGVLAPGSVSVGASVSVAGGLGSIGSVLSVGVLVSGFIWSSLGFSPFKAVPQ